MNYKITENLELIPIRNRYKPATIVLFLVVIVMIIFLLTKTDSVRIIYRYIKPTEVVSNDIELSEESITKCLHENGCVLPNVAVAQARLESSLGKSNVGKNAKNLFGITHHKCQYVTGKYGVYAKYSSYEDNIKCYIHIQDHYLKAINGVYASDLDYISKIKQIK